jgi:hypothetical protein
MCHRDPLASAPRLQGHTALTLVFVRGAHLGTSWRDQLKHRSLALEGP